MSPGIGREVIEILRQQPVMFYIDMQRSKDFCMRSGKVAGVLQRSSGRIHMNEMTDIACIMNREHTVTNNRILVPFCSARSQIKTYDAGENAF